MRSNSSTSIHRFSADAVVVSHGTLSEFPQTTDAVPASVAFQVPRFILLPPRHGSGLPHDASPDSQKRQRRQTEQLQSQSRSAIRKPDANASVDVLTNWTTSTRRTSTRSISSVAHLDLDLDLDHLTRRAGSPTLSSSESGSSHTYWDHSRSPTSSRPASASAMLNTYFPLHLSTPAPFQALFRGPDGRALFSTSTDGRTTVIRRLYGRAAQQTKTTKQKQDGLVLAEIEWTDRVRSSRIRFKGVDVDVRIDEYLKETRGGSGHSRMFATSDGRTYKWKAGCAGDSAELFECASGKRISGLLASSNPSTSSSNALPTPPPTPPIILSPSSSGAPVGAAMSPFASASAFTAGFEVPSISLSEPETRQEGEKPTLRVHTSVLNLVDQVIVTWVIMERDRTMRGKS